MKGAAPGSPHPASGEPRHILVHCPVGRNPSQTWPGVGIMSDPNPTVDLPGPQVAPSVPADATTPQRIGRYRVVRLQGKGGFGLVYLAHDDELHRPVAVKVPHRHRISAPED